jgi:predicted dienelactone hydrolase
MRFVADILFSPLPRGLWITIALSLLGMAAQASVGLTTLPATALDGPVTVFYPSSTPAQTIKRGPFELELAEHGSPVLGNGRLVVISHGSGGSPWVHSDLARSLVQAGFVVAMPQHRGDNYLDDRHPGPQSWAQRPAEVSRAIDALGRDLRFAPGLNLNRVGMYGMSAGGHTALSMAGGQWSPLGFTQHCEAHLANDFQTCVGLITRLNGGILDGLKKWIALAVIRFKFTDATPQVHADPRIAAVVSAVPMAADFDMSSLTQPIVPLALVTAQQDRWLVPTFHSDRVLAACKSCVHLADLPTGGHGAYLGPLPPGFTGLIAHLLNDPPGFDRSVVSEVDQKITEFFVRNLQGR